MNNLPLSRLLDAHGLEGRTCGRGGSDGGGRRTPMSGGSGSGLSTPLSGRSTPLSVLNGNEVGGGGGGNGGAHKEKENEKLINSAVK